MCSQRIVGFEVVAPHRRVFDGPVHPLDLTIGAWVVAHRSGIHGLAVPGLFGKPDTTFGENGVDLTGHRFGHVL